MNMGVPVLRWNVIVQSDSPRRYYRLFLANGATCMGTYNPDIVENKTFFLYARNFYTRHFRVPQLLEIASDKQRCLQTNLDNHTLYDFLCANRPDEIHSPQTVEYYEKNVKALPLSRLAGIWNFNFSVAYPRPAFDKQFMQWNLDYFKYSFLKSVNVPFHAQSLGNDDTILAEYLFTTDCTYSFYWDFQSTNIMIYEDDVYFIDYQGRRRGALPYDIASLLYDEKADLPPALRQHLFILLLESERARLYRPTSLLTGVIQSFTYKAGIPKDPTSNGGGYVFDSRALSNPGREKRFDRDTGKEDCIADYLSPYQSIRAFEEHVYALVDFSIKNYLQRQFTRLTVDFGCTGGQHRFVFIAEQLARLLHGKYASIGMEIEPTG